MKRGGHDGRKIGKAKGKKNRGKKRVEVWLEGHRTTIYYPPYQSIYLRTGQTHSLLLTLALRLPRMTNNKHRRIPLMEFLPIKNSLPLVLFARTLSSSSFFFVLSFFICPPALWPGAGSESVPLPSLCDPLFHFLRLSPSLERPPVCANYACGHIK